MLEIKKITKVYETEGFKQTALDKISVNFRESEFASILGPSGSGKTTFLNIIGGLDHYTSGDLIINEISTKKFKDSDWDAYRNHRIGFVFQNYNLISHQTILANVRLALTLSGISKKESIDRAKKALKDVGLEKHINKRPNQLSGGQMQRVAIARALVNDPDILLADEPTGALDSETSIQIMELLKQISKDKLVIMVTHNPELAEKYSSRIINIKDGKITSDSNHYDGKVNTKKSRDDALKKTKKTKMSFFTALSLSFNNLMTKKARTILVAFAGSIGIIGIALILAVSTGFQNYVDSIQEDTLTSYPLAIMQESTDIASALLSMRAGGNATSSDADVTEQQYLTSIMKSISTNDLVSFKSYIEKNYDKIGKDISEMQNSYSIDPLIYAVDAKNNLSKLNPLNLFGSMSSSSMFSSMTSIYSEMINNRETLDKQYDVLAGKWPEAYDELVIVLSEQSSISDLLVYSLGLRDTSELTTMVSKIMSGESVDITNTPKSFSYEDLMNVQLKLIEPSDVYKYNKKYDVYEDMTDDEEYMQKLYDKAKPLKIVGIVSAKEGVSSSALSPGVAYTSKLVDHIIEYASSSEAVKKQLKNEDVDVFSGNRFDSKKDNFNFNFGDLISIDNNKLQSAFNIKIDPNSMKEKTQGYMEEINKVITTDTSGARTDFYETLDELYAGLLAKIKSGFEEEKIESIVDEYMSSDSSTEKIAALEKDYVIPADTFRKTYSGIFKSIIPVYIASYKAMNVGSDSATVAVDTNTLNTIYKGFKDSTEFQATVDKLASAMTEAKVKVAVMSKVGELTSALTSSYANAFNIDESKISSAFKLKFTEDELMRVVSATLNKSESNAKSNLKSLGYQDRNNPTYISFYFNSFDSKEHFLSFIDDYNEIVKANGEDDKVINYSDTTGILMGSVKTIVNAVSYVLIAFVSISLVVSSIMIGIITYISVYERTKEIGILRSIGASKHNISSIFNAETFIVGLLSGMLGIGISYAFIPIINAVLRHFTGNIPLRAALSIDSAAILVVLSIILTLIGGFIPAKKASKKDPVEALRSE